MTKLTLGVALASMLAAGSAFAHHTASDLGTVRIGQAVMAGETRLQPGVYELRDTGEHIQPLPGQSDTALTMIEFVANGTVAARIGAEVIEGEPVAVGTSGRTTRPVVQMLKSGEFLRVSMYRQNERYLIHLPVHGN